MKMKLTIRRRTKSDGISGITTTVKLLADLKIEDTEQQIEFSVPEKMYEQVRPGTQWETELVELPNA